MLIASLLLILGLVILVIGAEMLVRGASSFARKLNVSELAIGLTIVAFGTSAPELVVNLFASSGGNGDISFGNIIGSNIFNILLILGIAGFIRPLPVQHTTTWKEIPFALLSAVVLWVLIKDSLFPLWANAGDSLGRYDGILLLFLFSLFLLYSWRLLKSEPATGQSPGKEYPLLLSLPLIAAGFGLLFGGGKLVVDNAVELAHLLGVSEKIIALTIVAGGTSLPELVTSAVAAYRNRPDIAIGNVVGSNIFNILLILGICGTVTPIGYPSSFDFDMLVLLAATVLLFVFMFTGKKHKLDRWEAGIFLMFYLAYTGYSIFRA